MDPAAPTTDQEPATQGSKAKRSPATSRRLSKIQEEPPPIVLTNPPLDYDPFQSQPQPWTANDWDHVWETSGNLDFYRDVFNEAAAMQLATAATPAVASHDGLTGAPQEDVSSISSDGNMSTNSSDDRIAEWRATAYSQCRAMAAKARARSAENARCVEIADVCWEAEVSERIKNKRTAKEDDSIAL